MKIELKNVRQHESLNLDLPDRGVVLISGRSGAGKTTVFDAIEDALYGSQSNIRPIGGGSPIITLSLGVSTITRKRNPGALELTTPSGKLIDDQAQSAIIENVVGLTQEEFETCAYIRQEGAGSILSLTAANQLKFIQKLASGNIDPAEIKERLKADLKGHEASLAINEQKLASAASTLAELTAILDEAVVGEWAPSDLAASLGISKDSANNSIIISNIGRELSGKTKEVTVLNLQNQELSSKLLSYDQEFETVSKKRTSLNEQIARLEAEGAFLLQAIDDVKAELGSLDGAASVDVGALKKEQADLEKRIKFLEIQEQAAQYASTIPNIDHTSPITPQLNAIASELDSKLSATNSEIKLLQTDLLKLTHIQKCPKCSTGLIVDQGTIKDQGNVTSSEEIKSSIASKELERATLLKERALWTEHLETANAFKAKLSQHNSGIKAGKDEALAKLETISIQISEADKNQVLKTAKKQEFDGLLQKRSRAQRDLLQAQEQLKLLPEIPSKEALLEKQNNLISQIKENEAQERVLKDNFEAVQQAAKELSDYVTKKALSDKRAQRKKELEGVVALSQAALAESHQKYLSVKRAIEIVDAAALECIENTINQINANTERFVSKMFEDDGTTIKLKNFATTKKGEDRAKISVEVFHKGQSFSSINMMSGGEKARARLAFQLGLASLYVCPLILIDEGFVGLSDNDKRACMSVLSEVGQDKLVLVIEHGASNEYFDHIVNL